MHVRIGRWLHWLFEASLAAKGAFAALEALSGLALLFLKDGAVLALAQRLTAHELSEDRSDVLANALLHGAEKFSITEQNFYAFYFLSHGGLKLAVVLLLALGILWAYPLAVALLTAFIAYQMHLWSIDHSPMMLALTALDVLVIALTLREWHERRRA